MLKVHILANKFTYEPLTVAGADTVAPACVQPASAIPPGHEKHTSQSLMPEAWTWLRHGSSPGCTSTWFTNGNAASLFPPAGRHSASCTMGTQGCVLPSACLPGGVAPQGHPARPGQARSGTAAQKELKALGHGKPSGPLLVQSHRPPTLPPQVRARSFVHSHGRRNHTRNPTTQARSRKSPSLSSQEPGLHSRATKVPRCQTIKRDTRAAASWSQRARLHAGEVAR